MFCSLGCGTRTRGDGFRPFCSASLFSRYSEDDSGFHDAVGEGVLSFSEWLYDRFWGTRWGDSRVDYSSPSVEAAVRRWLEDAFHEESLPFAAYIDETLQLLMEEDRYVADTCAFDWGYDVRFLRLVKRVFCRDGLPPDVCAEAAIGAFGGSEGRANWERWRLSSQLARRRRIRSQFADAFHIF